MSTVPLSHAKTHLARLVAEVQELGEQVLITRSGRPAAVLLPVQEYEGLIETLEILADPELSKLVRTGLDEAASGDLVDETEVWCDLDVTVHE